MFVTQFTRSQSRLSRLYSLWHPGKVIRDRKSEFQGRCVAIYKEDDVEEYLRQFKEDHKRIIKSASHPYIYAWRVGEERLEESPSVQNHNFTSSLVRKQSKKSSEPVTKYVNVREGYNDCGEKMGGSELMRRTLYRYDLYNVLVIVTRWMYGSAIGPKRFSHIGAAGTDSLREGGFMGRN